VKTKFLAALLFAIAPAAFAQSLDGLWDATITFNGEAIPFRLQIAGEGAKLQGWLFNGQDKVVASGASFQNGSLVLNFDSYAAKLEAKLQDGALVGQYGPMLKKTYPVTAHRHSSGQVESVIGAAPPSINGLWEVAVKSSKGEQAWRLIVQQKSASDVSAAILRVDGDTGTLVGRYVENKFVLNTFDGGRGFHLELVPEPAGKLSLVYYGIHSKEQQLTALRPAEARAQGIGEPTDPEKHTRMKDPTEPLRFSFPNLSGQTVSNTDPRFRGKVVLVNITGSWCPNCHDEAPFLEELYKKYRSLGLEIVALDFEEAEQLKDPTRLPAFVKKYGLEYTYLVAGTPAELNEKLPQAENLNSWPTTFFVGRDGRVRAVHAGFAAKASGQFHVEMRDRFTNTVERLLSENAPVASSN